jgi:hypothetical protein
MRMRVKFKKPATAEFLYNSLVRYGLPFLSTSGEINSDQQ